jgi:hypothetical protein
LIYKKITNNAGRKSQHESKDYQNLEVCTEKLEKCFERNSASNLIDNKVIHLIQRYKNHLFGVIFQFAKTYLRIGIM